MHCKVYFAKILRIFKYIIVSHHWGSLLVTIVQLELFRGQFWYGEVFLFWYDHFVMLNLKKFIIVYVLYRTFLRFILNLLYGENTIVLEDFVCGFQRKSCILSPFKNMFQQLSWLQVADLSAVRGFWFYAKSSLLNVA